MRFSSDLSRLRWLKRTGTWDYIEPHGYHSSDFSHQLLMGLYSHYDGAHNHPLNRALHMIAIPVGLSSLVVVWLHGIIGLLLIPSAFALAWLGHLIEGNKPAFLTHPAPVFVAPLWMARRIFKPGENKSA